MDKQKIIAIICTVVIILSSFFITSRVLGITFGNPVDMGVTDEYWIINLGMTADDSSAANKSYVDSQVAGFSGSFAPLDANYLLIDSFNGALTNERVLIGGDGILLSPGVANGNAVVQLRQDCALDDILKWDTSDWACATDDDSGGGLSDAFTEIKNSSDVSQFSAVGSDYLQFGVSGTGLDVGFDAPNKRINYSLITTCGNTQILKWNGATWACADDVGGGAGDGNDYVDGMSFNTGTGVLTLTRTGVLSDLTQDLDNRYFIDPGGVASQTLRYGATGWEASSVITNNGTNAGVNGNLVISGGDAQFDNSRGIYFAGSTLGFDATELYTAGNRLIVRSDDTSNVVQFTSYGIYLPQSGKPAGLYVQSPISARTGVVNDLGVLLLPDTVNIGSDALYVNDGGAVTISGDYTLPTTDGVANQVLTTNGLGAVDWQSVSGGAPTDATYLVYPSLNGSLSAERLLQAGAGISIVDGGANGNLTISNVLGNSIESSEITNNTIVAVDVNSSSIQLRVDGSCVAGSSIRVINSDGTVTCDSGGGAPGGINTELQYRVDASTFGGANIFYETLTKHTGINIQDPEATLHIFDPGTAMGNWVKIESNTLDAGLIIESGDADDSYIRLAEDDVDRWYIMNDGQNNNTLKIKTPLTVAGIYMQQDGDVGIGIPVPMEKLHVDGAIRIGDAANNDNGTIRWTGTDFEGRKGGAWTSLTDSGGSSFWTQNGTDIYYDAGQVGIGTISPLYDLHIKGGGTVMAELKIEGVAGGSSAKSARVSVNRFDNTVWAENYYQTGGFNKWSTGLSANSNNFTIMDRQYGYAPFVIEPNVPDSNILYIDSTGYVGIGTNSPGEKLDVVGNAEINGTLDMTQHEIKNMRIENLTSDPGAPEIGQIWICTDAGGDCQ